MEELHYTLYWAFSSSGFVCLAVAAGPAAARRLSVDVDAVVDAVA